MKVIRNETEFEGLALGDTVVTVGVFDGVHRGHRKVIERLIEARNEEGMGASVLLTFDRHPLSVIHPEMAPPLLTTLEEKISILGRMDLDFLIVENFSVKTAGVDYRSFVSDKLIGRLGMRHLVVGYDFHLGRAREGSQERLTEEAERVGFGISVVPPVVLKGRVVSSSKIRRAIIEGRLEHAAAFLGRDYFFDAEVVSGLGLGRRLDFPTANLLVREGSKLLPPGGVYAVDVEVEGARYAGMMNIGSAPTLQVGGAKRIEVHLLGFSGDLYGKTARVGCVSYVRKEKLFESAEALKDQLLKDKQKVSGILKKKR